MTTKTNEVVMKEKCLCEGCDSKTVLEHFEKCEKCGSEAYHSAPSKLNKHLLVKKEEPKKPKRENRY